MATIAQTLEETCWQHNRKLFPVVRKIQVQKAGGFVKARFAGHEEFTFGFTKEGAIKRLKYWERTGGFDEGRMPTIVFDR